MTADTDKDRDEKAERQASADQHLPVPATPVSRPTSPAIAYYVRRKKTRPQPS
jgi:hypothetical protein